MHRLFSPLVCGLTAALLAGSPALTPSVVFAQEENRAKDGDEERKPTVPLRKIVLFTSGVGYFEHRGAVSGNASVELKFNVDDVNDLLKSMVVQDLGGGTVSTVTYGSRDPVTKALQTFAIDLTSSPSLADLLRQIRGERVEIEAPNKTVGTIIGVETRRQKVKGNNEDEVIETDILTLLTETGLRNVPLDSVASIRLLNERLDDELRQALGVLAAGNATDKKTVTLSFLGEKERPVRVGYVQETPVWKTSYRLVIADDKAPVLQGWAIVENQTENDWDGVQLSLISGRPISFKMDLYQPLYVQRPLVVPELYASLLPPEYRQDLSGKLAEVEPLTDEAENRDRFSRRLGVQRGRGLAQSAPAPAARPEELGVNGALGYGAMMGGMGGGVNFDFDGANFAEGVQSVAQAEDVGELFQYNIETPVTLERQKSAMLPILNAEVEGEKLSIYNANVQRKHPLNGYRLKNTTELHLMQGPITVFDDGAYAGDGRIEDLGPGSDRLVGYALDLKVEVVPESKSHPEELVSAKIVKGTLEASRKFRRTTTYTVKNSAERVRNLLVEHAHDPNWKLVEPKEPTEKTRDLYRFAVEAKPGEPAKVVVTEEQTLQQSIALISLDHEATLVYLRAESISEEVKQSLRKVIEFKQQLSQLAAQRNRLEQHIQSISQEQQRIRENMAQLTRNTELYNRYVKKFSDQEDEVEKLRVEIDKLQDEQTKVQQALDTYLANLNVDG